MSNESAEERLRQAQEELDAANRALDEAMFELDVIEEAESQLNEMFDTAERHLDKGTEEGLEHALECLRPLFEGVED